MRVVGYDAACAGCHENSVHGGEALALLTLPQAPESLGLKGHWPDSGLGITPLMLAAFPEEARRLAEALSPLPDSDQLGLGDASEKEAEASRVAAAAVQELYHQLWQEGPQVLAARLAERGFWFGDESVAAFPPLSGLGLDTLRSLLFPGVPWELGEFAFPRLDLRSLNAALAPDGRSIGGWPSGASAGITPLMRYVLSQDGDVAEALGALEKAGRELGDLAGASAEEIVAAETVAWAVKDLYARLATGGAPFLEQFEGLSGGVLNTKERSDVLKKVFYAAQEDPEFLAGYADEWSKWKAGERPPAVVEERPAPGTEPDPSPDPVTDDDFGDDKPRPAPADDDFGSDDDFSDDKPKPAPADDDFGRRR